MVNRPILFMLFLFLLSAGGCARGWVYTDVVTPFCTDMENNSTDVRSSSSGLKQVNIPRVPGARAVWSSNSIADAAKAGGINRIEYCDRERFSLLGGLWERDYIVVYGN